MATIIRFVDTIAAAPTTLLDLNTAPLMVAVQGIDMSPPGLRRSTVETFLGLDGDLITGSAPENRVVKIPLNVVQTATSELVAAAITNLHTQLSAARNILMVQLAGMTNPVFFRTYAATDYSLKMLRLLMVERTEIEVEIPAEPYGYGPKVTLSQRTMFNSMYAGTQASINGDFETNVAGWEIETGTSTFTRSTAQFHAGAASGLITPNGTSATVRARLSANITASVGQQWRARGWLRCAAARTISMDLGFFNGSSLIGSWNSNSFSVSANQWNHFDVSATAPASTTGVRIAYSAGSTPSGSHLIYGDELRLHQHHVDGSMYTDITGILGDTDTPMFLKVADNLGTSNTGQRMTLLSMRKGGNPDNVPFVIESETLTTTTDTVWLLDNLATGFVATNGSYIATTFATNANLIKRMSTTWPTAWSTDLRGKYDVYIRVRGTSGNVYKFQLKWGNSSTATLYAGDVITVPTTPTSVWFYMYAGTISFPTGYDPVTEGYSNVGIDAAQLYIELHIQRVSGANGFDVDSFNFFPADEQSCLIRWPAVTNCTNYIIDGRATSVYGLDGSGRSVAVDAIAIAGSVPLLRPGVTNRLFFARDVGYGVTSTQALGAGDDPEADTTVTPFYWPRYWMIRQATT